MKKLAVLSIVLLMFLLAGCSEKPDKVVNNYLSALKAGELEKADKMSDTMMFNDYSSTDAALSKAILSRLEYKNIKVKETSQKEAIVSVDVSSLDTVQIVSTFVMEALQGNLGIDTDNMTDEAMDAALIARFKATDAPTKVGVVDITLVKKDKKWQIVVNESLQTALFGIESQADAGEDQGDMQYEIIEEKTVTAKYTMGDKSAGMCSFDIDGTSLDMYCDDAQYATLEKDFSGKQAAKITYQILQTADGADTVFVLVNIIP